MAKENKQTNKEAEPVVDQSLAYEKGDIPINKYSVYDLKSAMDNRIAEFLESKGFQEIHQHTNLKIVVGMFCLVWTALAYFNGRAFPDNYSIIMVSLAFYSLGSLVYWYVEKYMIKNTFYITENAKYFSEVIKNERIKYIKLNSDVRDNEQFYTIWLSVVTHSGKEIECDKLNKSFCEYFNSRGYCIRLKVNELAEELLLTANKASKQIN